MPKEPEAAAAARREAIAQALMGAARVPLEDGADLPAGRPARRDRGQPGQPQRGVNAGVAALLAEAACRGAVLQRAN